MNTDDPVIGLDMQAKDSQQSIRLAAFDQYRGLLFSVAYRMLGSVADAEDMLQETFIRWQQASDEEIRSPRAFLVTIVSRLCINHLQSARARREESVGQWLPEPLVTSEGNDPFGLIRVDETLSMAFLVLLERLTPVERAVFLLREVFEYEYSEISAILGQSVVNCRQILSRARTHIEALRPRFEVSKEEQKNLLQRFLEAASTGDMDGLLHLLSSDVVLYADRDSKAPGTAQPVRGSVNVARGAVGGFRRLMEQNVRPRIVEINGEPGIVGYLNDQPFSAATMYSKDGRIHTIYIVNNPEKLAHIPSLATVEK